MFQFRSAVRWIFSQWISRLWIDPVMVGAAISIHAALVVTTSFPSLLSGTLVADRPSLYAASAIVLSLTGTLGSVSVAQYLQARGDRARELKRRHPGVLGRSWKVIFSSTIVGSLLFLAAFRADLAYVNPQNPVDTGTSVGEWIFELGALVALAALLRLVLLFGQLVDLIVLDDTEPVVSEVEVNPAFFSRIESKAG